MLFFCPLGSLFSNFGTENDFDLDLWRKKSQSKSHKYWRFKRQDCPVCAAGFSERLLGNISVMTRMLPVIYLCAQSSEHH